MAGEAKGIQSGTTSGVCCRRCWAGRGSTRNALLEAVAGYGAPVDFIPITWGGFGKQGGVRGGRAPTRAVAGRMASGGWGGASRPGPAMERDAGASRARRPVGSAVRLKARRRLCSA
ncbi:hypothetical protein HVPorG_04756 (plasmid) [Roseomonas mucosa]|nr:hypothetical protein HVPorG_04756 [Roseomonas mucosa]